MRNLQTSASSDMAMKPHLAVIQIQLVLMNNIANNIGYIGLSHLYPELFDAYLKYISSLHENYLSIFLLTALFTLQGKRSLMMWFFFQTMKFQQISN